MTTMKKDKASRILAVALLLMASISAHSITFASRYGCDTLFHVGSYQQLEQVQKLILQRLQEASQSGDIAAVDAARKALLQQIRTEAKRISGKYIAPPHTTDFAVMFLPVEGLYAEVVQQSDLVDSIQREQRVVIAGPSTFSALLNALQMGFRTLAIEKRSGEVWKLLGTVKADFGAFSDVLEKTQLRLRQASESIDSAFVKTRNIQRHLGRVESAGYDGMLPESTEE